MSSHTGRTPWYSTEFCTDCILTSHKWFQWSVFHTRRTVSEANAGVGAFCSFVSEHKTREKAERRKSRMLPAGTLEFLCFERQKPSSRHRAPHLEVLSIFSCSPDKAPSPVTPEKEPQLGSFENFDTGIFSSNYRVVDSKNYPGLG